MARQVVSFEPEGLKRGDRRKLARQVTALGLPVNAGAAADGDDDLPRESRAGGGANPFVEDRSYWNPLRLIQPTHQATSLTLAGVYPFLADPPVEASGPVLGIDVRSGGEFSCDLWDWYNLGRLESTNVLLIGAVGMGKSHFAKAWACRSLLFGRQSIIPSDSKGEWGKTAEFVGGQVVRLGGDSNAQMNPLDAGPRRAGIHDADHARVVESRRRSVLVALIDTLLPDDSQTEPHEHTVLDWALDLEIALTDDRPTIGGVYNRLVDAAKTDNGYYPDIANDKRRIQHTLRRLVQGDLAGLFDAESSIQLDVDSPMTVIDTEALAARGDTALALAQICTNAWVRAAISDKHSGRKFFIFREEGWRDMNSIAALQQQRIQLKLGREYGISSVFILHKVSDIDAVGAAGSAERALAETILGDISNKIIFRQESGELPRTMAALGISVEEAEEIRNLQRGTALIRMKDRTFVVNSFLTSTALERELFKSDYAMAERAVAAPTAAVAPPPAEAETAAPWSLHLVPPPVEDPGDDVDQLDEKTIMVRATPAPVLRLTFDSQDAIEVSGGAAIGRRPVSVGGRQAVAVKSPNRELSKTHALVDVNDDGDILITDNDSSNGIRIEGRTPPYLAPGEAHVIAPGTTLIMGDVKCTIEAVARRAVG